MAGPTRAFKGLVTLASAAVLMTAAGCGTVNANHDGKSVSTDGRTGEIYNGNDSARYKKDGTVILKDRTGPNKQTVVTGPGGVGYSVGSKKGNSAEVGLGKNGAVLGGYNKGEGGSVRMDKNGNATADVKVNGFTLRGLPIGKIFNTESPAVTPQQAVTPKNAQPQYIPVVPRSGGLLPD